MKILHMSSSYFVELEGDEAIYSKFSHWLYDFVSVEIHCIISIKCRLHISY